MERRQNDLKGRFVWEFGVGINGDTTAIIRYGQPIPSFQQDFNACGMACNGFIHRIVENFGGKMMIGALIRAANIHAGPAPDWLQTLKNLNR
jgi:hypothetical protein